MSILTTIFFYLIAAILLGSAIFTIFTNGIIKSVLSAILIFLCVAGIYFMLNATFNGVVQVSIYVIAVSILFIFAIMFTPYKQDKKMWLSHKPRTFFVSVALGLLFISVAWLLFQDYLNRLYDFFSNKIKLNDSLDTVNIIGEKLLTDYFFAFEMISLILLIIVVGLSLVCVWNKKGDKK